MSEGVETHYSTGQLEAVIDRALSLAGKDPGSLQPEDLAAFEDFHTLGRAATIELAQLAGITAGDQVLDVGSGIGGPARLLAREFGAVVTGVDLTAEFCEVANSLSRRSGLGQQTTFRVADALALPFADATFDVVWTQHVAMNIQDKSAFYTELRRIVKTGGRLAMFDLVAGPLGDAHYPVPWATESSISFLEPATAIRDHITAAGFEITVWNDLSGRAKEYFGSLTDQQEPRSPLGPHLLIPDLNTKAGNVRRNLEEDRLALLQVIAHAV
jgi:MPBQ/MSBQ methyltransferase